MFTEISVNDINDFRLGHASNKEAGTGVTVIYFPDGATAGCDISGGGPASRETPLTMPMTADIRVPPSSFSPPLAPPQSTAPDTPGKAQPCTARRVPTGRAPPRTRSGRRRRCRGG